ncbi:hypothetical protein Dsin_002083 [Dipteronia sinensis]|uniref:HAT C-terminal dimerisation domain-containing protein n=1 Tax=Dipteronia sinensis TaxID=43782 RepID=A0AAE0B6I3_9ROSI|nr:hypothetical protein Dsin_002083 [Dipteronia sinensis]
MECYFPTIYRDKTSDEIKKIHDLLLRMIREYMGKSKAKQTSSVSSSGDPTHVSSSPSTTVFSRTRLNHLSLFDQFISLASSATIMKIELESYLEESIIPRTNNFNILGWWNVKALNYPTLHYMARDILAILLSTVAFESTFSTGGRVVDTHRSRLHPKTFVALMCAQDWLWYEFKDSSLESKFGASTFDDDDDDDDDC